MKPLHATDPMGSAANRAALAAHMLDFWLLSAGSPSLAREERAAAAERAFRIWFPLVRAMTALEQAAPNAAERARQADLKVRDWIEAANAERSEVTATVGEVSPGSTP